MAIISKEIVFEGAIEYYCNLWGKIFEIYYVSDADFFMIFNDFKCECPKCNTPYGKPEHGDKIECSKCFAEFEFFGALHPRPIGETKKEVEKVLDYDNA